MGAIVEKTINHSGRGHVIGRVHEDGTKTDVIEERGVKIENGIGGIMCGPVHSKQNGLGNKNRVAIGEQSKNSIPRELLPSAILANPGEVTQYSTPLLQEMIEASKKNTKQKRKISPHYANPTSPTPEHGNPGRPN
jgi:hypothetical protein